MKYRTWDGNTNKFIYKEDDVQLTLGDYAYFSIDDNNGVYDCDIVCYENNYYLVVLERNYSELSLVPITIHINRKPQRKVSCNIIRDLRRETIFGLNITFKVIGNLIEKELLAI